MTLFAVHDESGEITQANKVFDPEGYDKLLEDRELRYVAEPRRGLIRPGHYYVDRATSWTKELKERPEMQVTVDKQRIKAGSDDSALITGIPRDASVKIFAVGQVLHSFDKLDADQIEICIPVPCTYTVMIDLWPYKTWKTTIEAA